MLMPKKVKFRKQQRGPDDGQGLDRQRTSPSATTA